MSGSAESLDEAERLGRVEALGLMGTEAEARLDSLTARALALFPGASSAALSLVGSDRVWFKARVGLTRAELPRNVAFCSHTVGGRGVLVVPDLTQDRRFACNVLVTSTSGARFYIGAPLTGGLGALCVVGPKPQHPTELQVAALVQLALFADSQLLMCGALRSLARSHHPASP